MVQAADCCGGALHERPPDGGRRIEVQTSNDRQIAFDVMARAVALNATVEKEPAGALAETDAARDARRGHEPCGAKRLVQAQHHVVPAGAQASERAKAADAAMPRTLVIREHGIDVWMAGEN